MILSPTTHSKPRIISELKKLDVIKVPPSRSGLTPPICPSPPAPKFSKPYISGEVTVDLHLSSEPQSKFVEVRDGHLVVYNNSRLPELRLALHHLNLQADPGGRPWTFRLTKQNADSTPLVTISMSCQQDYDRWVKTLAAELLSQTPLEAIRFLDILGITATLESTKSSNKLSPEDTKTKSPSSPQRSRHCSTSDTSPLPDVVKDLPPGHLNGRKSPARDIEHPEWFHQRLLLFESLCNKHNSSSFSSNNSQSTGNTLLVTPSNLSAKHRAISCHNLSQNNTQPVKDICKYFEEKNQLLAPPGPTIQDYIPTPPREHEVAKRRFSHLDHSFTPLVRLTKHIS